MARNRALLPSASKELRPSANSHAGAILEAAPPAPVKISGETTAPTHTLITASSETCSQNHSAELLPNFCPHRDCEIINICCFKLQHFGVFSYTAIDNSYSKC